MAKKNVKTEELKIAGQTKVNGRTADFASYKVLEGETIYSIWIKFRDKSTVGAIKAANSLQSNDLAGVKTLKIPLVL
ncbi:LysM peptidoglycan-binding domain-containing protein [Lentilactobacillus senioris]|uniref:LysM peptidoglycan-binding domain-containing protein n=1 Tax=Lentilactobacillus senioris TaxID=931534 RepID=UPI003D2B4FAF